MTKILSIFDFLSRLFVGAFLLLLSQTMASAAEIPAEADWTDHGTIISHGNNGQWDRYLFGMMTPSALVYKDGTYFLYYIGGDSEDGSGGDARNRRLGVATSTDLTNWTKYAGNPILDWDVTGGWEEGISSAVAFLDGNEIVLYYNALTDIGGDLVKSDIRVATSSDGFSFSNDALVLGGVNAMGMADEAWPTGVIRDGSNTYLYYSGDSWNIYMLTLSDKTTITSTELVLNDANNIIHAEAVQLGASGDYAVFLPYQTFGAPWTTSVRTTNVSDPGAIGSEVEQYNLANVGSHQAYFLDDKTNQWLMFYQTNPGNVSNTSIGLMTAPSGATEKPKPNPPTELIAE